eukprot:COSAG01_NODE_6948_length_3426_cov_3.373910_2_plen_123_part_00
MAPRVPERGSIAADCRTKVPTKESILWGEDEIRWDELAGHRPATDPTPFSVPTPNAFFFLSVPLPNRRQFSQFGTPLMRRLGAVEQLVEHGVLSAAAPACLHISAVPAITMMPRPHARRTWV